MRFDGGWVKIQRSITSNDKQANKFWGDSGLLALWMVLICWANYKKTKARLGNKEVIVNIGQIITGTRELCIATGLSTQEVRGRLQLLQDWQMLTIKTTNKGSLITICNYEKYQVLQTPNNKQNNKRVTNDQQTSNKRVTNDQQLSEEGKNARSEEGKNINRSYKDLPPCKPEGSTRKKPLLKFEAEDSALADKWIVHALSISATGKFDVDKFANAIRKARELMKFSHSEMKALLNFIVKDDFWHDKAYSPVGLTKRSKSNEQPKIANIAASAFKKNREWKNILSWAKDQDSKSNTADTGDDLQDFNFLKNF